MSSSISRSELQRDLARRARMFDAAPEMYELIRYIVDNDILVESKPHAVALLARIDGKEG